MLKYCVLKYPKKIAINRTETNDTLLWSRYSAILSNLSENSFVLELVLVRLVVVCHYSICLMYDMSNVALQATDENQQKKKERTNSVNSF